ncbi:MAG: hypothetical protein OEV43_00565 [Coriobacteriia bacterium]|nr:hypothetical protein [Coriobacteriia bacterium]
MTNRQSAALHYAIYNLGQQAEQARVAGRDRLAEQLDQFRVDLDSLRNDLAMAKRTARIGGTVDVVA